MPKCRYCEREITFVQAEKGKLMPCEPVMVVYERNDYAGVRLLDANTGAVVKGRRVEDGKPGARLAYVPHFGGCPGRRASARAKEAEPHLKEEKSFEPVQMKLW